MDSTGLRAKAETLRALHVPGRPLVLVNAWDAATASLMERAGAAAVATSSAAAANALGYPDGEQIGRDRMLSAVAAIAAAVALPVTADMEAGYGADPQDAAATARGLIEAGAVGLTWRTPPAETRPACCRSSSSSTRSKPSGRSPPTALCPSS